MDTILHITARADWVAAQQAGQYESESLHTQGFIHCSRPDQVLGVANSLFRGRADLVLLCIDADKVGPEICCENLEGGETLFPHIYGSLNLDAVMHIHPFPPGNDGTFKLPSDLAVSRG